MAATTPKLVTVFGATGQQGGAIVQSLLQNPQTFRVRAITRNPESDAAKALAKSGVEVVQANGFDYEAMRRAFQGSWAAVVNTNSDDPEVDDGKREAGLGKRIMDAAVAAGVKVMVYSSLPWVNKLTGGEVRAWLCDSKAEILTYARTLPFEMMLDYMPGWYMGNFKLPEFAEAFGGFPLNTDSEGYLTMRYPPWGSDEPMNLIAVSEDLGDIVHGMLLDPAAYRNRSVHAVSQLTSYDDIVATYSKLTGKKARSIECPINEFQTHGVHVLEEMKALFDYLGRMGGRYFGTDVDVKTAKKLKAAAVKAKVQAGFKDQKEEMTTWEEWVPKNLN